MVYRHSKRHAFRGQERRTDIERRVVSDRRNLYRFEAWGSERRESPLRRRKDGIWMTTQLDS